MKCIVRVYLHNASAIFGTNNIVSLMNLSCVHETIHLNIRHNIAFVIPKCVLTKEMISEL
jgi:hypothetical protein